MTRMTQQMKVYYASHTKGKVKGRVQLLTEPQLTATEFHLPYGITQCYLPPDTSEHIPL